MFPFLVFCLFFLSFVMFLMFVVSMHWPLVLGEGPPLWKWILVLCFDIAFFLWRELVLY